MSLAAAAPAVRAQAESAAEGAVAPAASAASLWFDIPAQSMQAALEQFSTLTGHSGLYDSAILAGIKSRGVQGLLAPQAALQQLAAGTGLQVRYATADTFSLVRSAVAAAPAVFAELSAVQQEAARQHYYGLVQSRVESVFCKDAQTAPGPYRMALSFWIDTSGVIERVHLLDTSGSAARDRRISNGIGGLQVGERLPSGLKQPVTMIIEPKPPAETGDCLG